MSVSIISMTRTVTILPRKASSCSTIATLVDHRTVSGTSRP